MRFAFDPLFGAIGGDSWFPSPAHVMRRAAILDMLRGYAPGRLVEMGCGAGRMLVDWDRLGHRGTAVDLDPTARRLAASCVAEFDAGFDIAERVDAPAEHYDYLVASEVLEHVEDPAATLKNWVRHLREGGIFLATVPAFQHLWGRSDDWAGHVQRFEPDAFRGLVEAAGLEVIDVRLYGFLVGNSLRIAGNVASGFKMRRRSGVGRQEATYASGHDRSIERRLAPLMSSLPGRALLRFGIALQRRVNRGHGLVLIARKTVAADAESTACAA